MGLQINTNIAAMNAYRNLASTQSAMSTSLERLSSGLRINRAADDAAGLAISEKMRGQISGLNQASSNAQDGISLIQTAEGALNETHSILQRMRQLAVQSSNDTNSSTDRTAIQAEVNQLTTEIDRIAGTTQFNGQSLLNGAANLTLQIGANQSQTMAVTIGKMDTSATGLNLVGAAASAAAGNGAQSTGTTGTVAAGSYTIDSTGTNVMDSQGNQVGTYAVSGGNGTVTFTNASANNTAGATVTFNGDANVSGVGGAFTISKGVDMTTQANAAASITSIDSAIDKVSTQRANLGAYQNRLQHTINSLNVAAENASASESRIRDTDMAKEMTSFTRAQILQQAGVSMLAQANSAPQSVLKLLG